jgi:hypothetical protein
MRLLGRSRKHSQPRIYGFQGLFAKERIVKDNTIPRYKVLAGCGKVDSVIAFGWRSASALRQPILF